jgi:hypothetical protein
MVQDKEETVIIDGKKYKFARPLPPMYQHYCIGKSTFVLRKNY